MHRAYIYRHTPWSSRLGLRIIHFGEVHHNEQCHMAVVDAQLATTLAFTRRNRPVSDNWCGWRRCWGQKCLVPLLTMFIFFSFWHGRLCASSMREEGKRPRRQ
jgi:hypothetical protein